MEKYIVNLLAVSTPSLIQVTSANGIQKFSRTIINDNANDGQLYLQIAGFYQSSASQPVEKFTPKLYSSFNGASWFLHPTSSPYITALDTASSKIYYFNNIGNYIRLGYYATATVNARAMFEFNTFPKNL